MKKFFQTRILAKYALIIPFVGLCQLAFAQECKVETAALAGKYEGECKKGLADGEGTATGTDTYKGSFRKGEPHGKGIYTSANGDVYEGEFKKGIRHGAGKLTATVAGQSITTSGYWFDDDFIGSSPTPFKVHNRTAGVLSVNVRKMEAAQGEANALNIEILHKGRNVPPPDLNISETVGNIAQRFTGGRATRLVIAKWPIRITVAYMGESVDVEVSQEASWTVRIDYNK